MGEWILERVGHATMKYSVIQSFCMICKTDFRPAPKEGCSGRRGLLLGLLTKFIAVTLWAFVGSASTVLRMRYK
jgi:hypothetical protein